MSEESIDELEAKISLLERKIQEEPQRLLDEKNRLLNTMPASDEVIEQHFEHKHKVGVSRGEVQNIRISQARDGVLLLLFILGIISISIWIYNTFQAV